MTKTSIRIMKSMAKAGILTDITNISWDKLEQQEHGLGYEKLAYANSHQDGAIVGGMFQGRYTGKLYCVLKRSELLDHLW